VSLRNIGVVYRKELLDSLRDRRTVVSMIAVPILLMPLLTIGLGLLAATIMGRAMQEVPTVMILGGEDSPRVVAALQSLKEIHVVPAQPDYAARISDKQVRAAVEIPRDFDAAIERGDTATVRIYMYAGELRSSFGADRLQTFLRDLRERSVRERLQARGLPETLAEPFRIEEQNVAPPEKVSGAILGGLIPYFVIVLCLIGAMYPAMDLTAGEKERGTMETILSSPVSRTHLVLGKFLMVLTASLLSALLSMISMGATFEAGRGLLQNLEQFSGTTLPLQFSFGAMVAVFLMVVPLAVLFSAVLLTIALFAKSYKEAQSYLSPLTILVALPAVISALPGVELNAALCLVPVLNISLVSKEIVAGTYHWSYIGLIFASSCAYAAAALAVAIRLFQREEVLFRV
jgi:sodium transport system permease protein